MTPRCILSLFVNSNNSSTKFKIPNWLLESLILSFNIQDKARIWTYKSFEEIFMDIVHIGHIYRSCFWKIRWRILGFLGLVDISAFSQRFKVELDRACLFCYPLRGYFGIHRLYLRWYFCTCYFLCFSSNASIFIWQKKDSLRELKRIGIKSCQAEKSAGYL